MSDLAQTLFADCRPVAMSTKRQVSRLRQVVDIQKQVGEEF